MTELRGANLHASFSNRDRDLLFAKESIENPQILKYYGSPDTSTTCCACIRGAKFKSMEKSKSEQFEKKITKDS
ncbi:MAG: hypothetical protein V1793_22795 [Pseudomonadota bacterium]